MMTDDRWMMDDGCRNTIGSSTVIVCIRSIHPKQQRSIPVGLNLLAKVL